MDGQYDLRANIRNFYVHFLTGVAANGIVSLETFDSFNRETKWIGVDHWYFFLLIAAGEIPHYSYTWENR